MKTKKKQFEWTEVTGLEFVNGPGGVRLWAQYLLIDRSSREFSPGSSLPQVRQIRGFTSGGLPVFTFWIGPEKIEFRDQKGGNVVMIGVDGKSQPLDAGLCLVAQVGGGETLKLDLIERERGSIAVRDFDADMAPGSGTIDRAILKHYRAPNYPLVLYVPKDGVLDARKRMGQDDE